MWNHICVDLVRFIDLICKIVYIFFMGNSTSTQQSHYENYISQQQAQLVAQQQQIDRLFQMKIGYSLCFSSGCAMMPSQD